jgi:hypothetical protein
LYSSGADGEEEEEEEEARGRTVQRDVAEKRAEKVR